jgi:hypothetical protein
MQYLLTKQEYEELISSANKQKIKREAKLQEFCTLAARHIPIKVAWIDGAPKPWGCILLEGIENPGCCDECPAVRFCPYEDKEFSQ